MLVVNLDQKISPTMTLRNAVVTKTDFPNIPSPDDVENIKLFAPDVEFLNKKVGSFDIISWYRSNKLQNYLRGLPVGAAKNKSFHELGWAVDIKPHIPAKEFYRKILAQPEVAQRFGEIALKKEAGTIHLSKAVPGKVAVAMIVDPETKKYERLSLAQIREFIQTKPIMAGIGGLNILLLGLTGFLIYRSKQ